MLNSLASSGCLAGCGRDISVLDVPFKLLPEQRTNASRVGRWIPRDDNGALTFQDLARRSCGDSRLAVLKADVDDMGARVAKIAAADPTCEKLRSFSRYLHCFFAEKMQDEAENHWKLIYTVYAGGDDLLLVAPWQIMLDFAGKLAQQFQRGPAREAREYGPLTLSAGITLTPYRVPIRHAVEPGRDAAERSERASGKESLRRPRS